MTAQRRSLTGRAWRAARPALLAYFVVLLVMTFIETWLVYPAPPPEYGNWQPAGLDYEDVWFAAADGTQLHGWFVPHPTPRCAVVYCHGNGEDVAHNADLVALLRDELHASVLIFDYRGYGHSGGSPHEAGLIADGVAAQEWLADRMKLPADEIVLMGRSIGGAVAVAMAARLGARALVLESSFSRMTDTAARHFPWLPVRLLMRNRYDSLSRIQRFTGPLFQSHGTADRIVPIELGRQLFDTSPSTRKRFVELAGMGHNNLPPPSYYADLAEFLHGPS